ncbi:MAG: CPBP family intramembrane metalloprotease [Lachnospiraceae bacterium]|nr:CPBP family intramembrane metalloprotease [Lachnospiraceae bacterium]
MKKVGYFFLCFVPMIFSISIQIFLSFPATGICMMAEFAKALISGNRISIMELYNNLMTAITTNTFTSLVSIAFSLSCIFIFGFWYKQQFSGNIKEFPKNLKKPMVFLSIIFMVPGLQMLASMVTSITSALFPKWMEFYEKLIEAAGLSTDITFLMLIYAVLLGPIGEELIFRGVTLASAKRALPFWAANLFQALLFGVFHMNVIQGIYAFFVGLFMGYVCERGGSIYHSILLHILFNAWGTLLPTNIMSNPVSAGILLIVSIFVGIAGFFMFRKNTTLHVVNILPDSSDM